MSDFSIYLNLLKTAISILHDRYKCNCEAMIEERDDLGRTLLHKISNISDPNGQDQLYNILFMNHKEEFISNINIKDKKGLSPLLYAIKKNQIKYAEFLINNGADLSLCDEHGENSLLKATRYRCVQLVDLLAKKKVPNISNIYGCDSFCIIIQKTLYDNREHICYILEILLTYYQPQDFYYIEGLGYLGVNLHYLATEYNFDKDEFPKIITLLGLEKINIKSHHGETLLHSIVGNSGLSSD